MASEERYILETPVDRRVSEVTFHVRYAETDAMRIVHHSNYLVYCEELRSHFSRELGTDYADFERRGYALAVSEINLRFVSPAVYGQRVTVRGWVAELKSRRMVFGYQIFNPDTQQVHVTGTTTHICVTREGQVTRIPDDWMQVWKAAFYESA